MLTRHRKRRVGKLRRGTTGGTLKNKHCSQPSSTAKVFVKRKRKVAIAWGMGQTAAVQEGMEDGGEANAFGFTSLERVGKMQLWLTHLLDKITACSANEVNGVH